MLNYPGPMKRKEIIMRKLVTLLVIVFLLMCLTSCGLLPFGNANSQQGQQSTASNNGTIMNNGGENDPSSGSVPFGKDWPSELNSVPEFSYGKIQSAMQEADVYDGIQYNDYQVSFSNADANAAENYAADLERAGFDMVSDPYEMTGTSDADSYISYEFEKFVFETDDAIFNVDVDFWVNKDGTGIVFVSIPVNPGTGNNQPAVNDQPEDPANNTDSDLNWDTLSESSVPEGYPHDDVPLIGLDNSTILGASKQSMGDEGTAYIIVYGMNDAVDTVAETISTQLEQYLTSHGGTFQSIMSQMLMGEINNCQYTVSIGDGSADGYTTVISYTVICS